MSWPAPNPTQRLRSARMPRCFSATDLEQPGAYIEWTAKTKVEHMYVLQLLMAYRAGSGIDMKINACGDQIKVHRADPIPYA